MPGVAPGVNLTREEAAARAALVSVRHYAVQLDLTQGETTFGSRTTVTFDCHSPGASTFIDLIVTKVTAITLNGRSLPVAEHATGARITLPDLAAQNELTVEADATYMHSGEGLHRFVDPVDKEVYCYSQFEVADARRVFTCFDQPDLKASYAFTVTAPSHWQVISTSPTPAPADHGDGTATWQFETTPELSPYVTSIIGGPYRGSSDQLVSSDGRTIPLRVLARASLVEYVDAATILRWTKAGFACFEKLFDRPYPFAKYDQVFVPEFNAGAMENAGAVTITEIYVFRGKAPQARVERLSLTVLHELAHMWFGDLVTMRWWNDLWLNESFAEWASVRCQTEATEYRTAWTTFLSAEKAWAYRQDQLASTHPIVAEIRDLADVGANFDGITYAKGASVLKQLVHWVGQDAFDAGLRSYFAKHAWSNTTLADLLTELEATSGRDLSTWSKAWLQQAGVTTLRPELEVDADGVITAAAITQEAPAEHPYLRPHRLAIGCYDLTDGALTRSHRIERDVDGPRTEVPELVGRRRPDLLLANDDDLAYAKLRLDEHSLATATEHLAGFADSLPATLVWSAAWDMARDAELPARTFVDLLLSNLPSVDDASVRTTLLAQLATALTHYVAPELRLDAAAAAADRLAAQLFSAEPGGDRQLVLARALAGCASTPEQLDLLARLHHGDQQVPGLAIDTDLRWVLLEAMAAGGRADEAAIQTELDGDDTATGRQNAAACRAALPTAAAKAAAWHDVVEVGQLPNAVQAAVIRGFGRVHDTALLLPYVEPYFAALDGVWRDRTNEMATQIVEGLYPARLAGPELLARTENWLGESHPQPLTRLVTEARDGVARALRAQDRDRRP